MDKVKMLPLLAEAGKKLLGRARVRQRVARMHLWAQRLTRRTLVQGVLFPAHDEAAQRAAEVKRNVNGKLGRFAVRSGDTLPLWDIYAARTAGRLHPFVQVSNLTATSYQEIQGVLMPGRTVIGGFEFQLRRGHP